MTDYAKAGGSPALVRRDHGQDRRSRPDLVKLGRYRGPVRLRDERRHLGQRAAGLEAQAKAFTGYWGGTEALDAALTQATTGMAELLK